jgi:hypothetical protein
MEWFVEGCSIFLVWEELLVCVEICVRRVCLRQNVELVNCIGDEVRFATKLPMWSELRR